MRVGRTAVLIVLAMIAAVSCGSSSATGKAPEEPDPSGIYGAAIPVAVADVPLQDDDVVFVTMRDDHAPLALQAQATIVKTLEEQFEVQFVDGDEEAIDAAADGKPVAHGVLLRLGALDEQRPGELLVERYRDISHQELLVLAVSRSGATWTTSLTATKPVRP